MTLPAQDGDTGKPGRFLDAVLSALPAIYLKYPVPLGLLVFAVYVAIVMLVCAMQPQTDWDVLAYLAIAGERLFDTAPEIHAYAYDTLRNNVSAAEFALLTQDGAYRSQMFADPAGFVSMLGMYRVKWLYCELVVLLSAVMPPLLAIRLISAVSAAAFALVSLLWLKHNRALALSPIFVAVLILAGFSSMARAVSPDMLFAATFLAGLYAHVRKNEPAACLLLVVAFLVRPDNLIFLGGYAVLLLLYGQWRWGVVVAFAAAAVIFVPLVSLTGQPGWWEQLYFASVEKQTTLVGFHPPFSLTLYLYALVKQFLLAVTAEAWIGILILGLGAWMLANRIAAPLEKTARILMIGLALGTIAKFILVPIFDTRIYFPYLIAMYLLLSTQYARVSTSRATL